MTYTPELLLQLLRDRAPLGTIAGQYRNTSYALIEADARALGWVFDAGGRPHQLADDTPDGSELAQLDDRPSEANGDPGSCGCVKHPANHAGCKLPGCRAIGCSWPIPVLYAGTPEQWLAEQDPEPAFLDTGTGDLRPVELVELPDQVPDYHPHLVPVTLATRPVPAPTDPERRGPERMETIEPEQLTWLAVLGLTPVQLCAVIELARVSNRRALSVIAQAVIADLTDLANMIRTP